MHNCQIVIQNHQRQIGIVDKFNDIEGDNERVNRISNYMTSPGNGRFSFMDLVQRMMFLGDYKAVDYHVYSENGYTTDAHCAFSFLELEDDEFRNPKTP